MAKRVHGDIAYDFVAYLSDVFSACSYIREMGACDKCPISHNCIDETTVAEFENFCTTADIKELLDLAEDVEAFLNENDYIADMADEQRKETDYWYD